MPFVRAPLTPGAYLKHRRTAARLSVQDVADRLTTDPASPAHERARQLELIEADIQPATFRTLVALLGIYSFDLGVLGTLELIAMGRADVAPPVLCRICACSDADGCAMSRGGPCAWAAPDLCTSCTPDALLVRGEEAIA